MDTGNVLKWASSRKGLACLGAATLALAMLLWWAGRAHQRSTMRDLLNRSVPIISPPMELQFSARRPDNAAERSLMQPGVAAGYWVVRPSSRPGELEVLVTRAGQTYFSTVGSSIVAGFHAGTRLITSVDRIKDSGTTREISFTYAWTSSHPAVIVLGQLAPQLAHPYHGEAMLVRSGDSWQLVQWDLPDFEIALHQFQ